MKPRTPNINALRGLVMFTMVFVNDLASAQNERLMVAADPPRAGAGALGDVFHAGKLAELDAAIDQAINDSKMVGAVLWVERQGAAYHKAFGQRATKPAAEAMTEDTIFDVASITKAVATTSAAMWCVDRGLFAVDDPVAKHLPEFTGEGREKMTLRHLLLVCRSI